MKSLLCVLAICLTSLQVKNEVCRLVCRNDSYDTGQYLSAQKSCLCGVMKKYEDLEEKPLRLPSKNKSDQDERITINLEL